MGILYEKVVYKWALWVIPGSIAKFSHTKLVLIDVSSPMTTIKEQRLMLATGARTRRIELFLDPA